MSGIKGYTPLTEQQKAHMNQFKELEERVMRMIDIMEKFPEIDQRALAVGRTNIQTSFMWLNRSVAKPGRTDLPEDALHTQAP